MIAKVNGTCSEGWAWNDSLRKKYTACYFSFRLHEVKTINHQFELEQILGHLPPLWCLQYAKILSFFTVVRRPQDIKIPNLAILPVWFFKPWDIYQNQSRTSRSNLMNNLFDKQWQSSFNDSYSQIASPKALKLLCFHCYGLICLSAIVPAESVANHFFPLLLSLCAWETVKHILIWAFLSLWWLWVLQ